MSYTPDSPIRGASPLNASQTFAALTDTVPSAERTHVREYLDTLDELCQTLGLDLTLLTAQWDLETGSGTSEWWRDRKNPAGIGITGNPEQNAASQVWSGGREAAFGHVAHMVAYVWGSDWQTVWPDAWPRPIDADKRFTAPIDAGFSAVTLGDLNNTWAIDPQNDYHGKLAARANRILATAGKDTPPMAEITFGNVPKPTVVDRHLDYPNHSKIGFSDEEIVIEGVVWHRMIGTLWGTDGWFFDENAATAYGVGVAATDGDAEAGKILEWIDPANGHFYGHSSGPVDGQYGDGELFVDRFGINRVNPQTVAIEISGNYNTPLDEKARQSIVSLTAYFADQRKIPWTEFPIVPGQGRSFVIWHQEFTLGTGKICPGQVVMAETSQLISRVKEHLRGFQTSDIAPADGFATPQAPERGSQIIDDRVFLAPGGKTVQVATAPRLWADASSPATGPEFPEGHEFTQSQITHYVQGTDGDLWVVLEDGSRFPARALIAP